MAQIFNKWSSPQPDVAEKIEGESLTQPDMCLSVSEIFQQFVLTGQTGDASIREPLYPENDGEELICLEDLDLIELAELRDEISQRIEDSKKESTSEPTPEPIPEPTPEPISEPTEEAK
nr:MAG: hypothetical protein [Microviridae sp.]